MHMLNLFYYTSIAFHNGELNLETVPKGCVKKLLQNGSAFLFFIKEKEYSTKEPHQLLESKLLDELLYCTILLSKIW